jgi:hypothetical protein
MKLATAWQPCYNITDNSWRRNYSATAKDYSLMWSKADCGSVYTDIQLKPKVAAEGLSSKPTNTVTSLFYDLTTINSSSISIL